MSTKKEAATAWEALFRAQVEIMRRFEADDLMPELTLKEYDVLFALRNLGEPGARLKELNQYVLMHQSAFSRLVERLETRGLVQRTVAPDDKRGTLISLTTAGAELQRTMGRKHVAQIKHYVGGALGSEDLAALTRIATTLREAQSTIEPFTLPEQEPLRNQHV